VALNAADEVAVTAFLEGSIGFDEIPRIIEDAVSASNSGKLESIAKVLEADAEARRYAQERVLGIKKTARSRATSVV
jgi:1-deoxy-D-xylulose-5-phosphate reductoisomerase